MAMKHQAVKIAKGVSIGMAVGGTLGLAAGAIGQPKYQRTAKKGFNKALKAVGNVIEAIS